MTRVGIFGFGRIGRNLFRLLAARKDMEIGAISDLADPAAVAYLLQFDTLLGRLEEDVAASDGRLRVGGLSIPLLTGKDQPAVPRWGDLGVHTVLEATSRGRTRAEVEAHLAAGARRVILLAPPLEVLAVRNSLCHHDLAAPLRVRRPGLPRPVALSQILAGI